MYLFPMQLNQLIHNFSDHVPSILQKRKFPFVLKEIKNRSCFGHFSTIQKRCHHQGNLKKKEFI